MDGRPTIYWPTTALIAFVLLTGGAAYLVRAEWAVDGVAALGYPSYLVTILGVWKVLGAVAILAPGYPRLKEWAYAGIAFDLSGAAFSHLASGSPIWHAVLTTGLLAVATVSWATRPQSRRLDGSPRRPYAEEPAVEATEAVANPA